GRPASQGPAFGRFASSGRRRRCGGGCRENDCPGGGRGLEKRVGKGHARASFLGQAYPILSCAVGGRWATSSKENHQQAMTGLAASTIIPSTRCGRLM